MPKFFHAILNGHLVVTVEQQPDRIRTIAQDTLEIELDNLPPRNPTRYYVQAIQEDTPQLTNPSGRLGQMGRLNVWINTAQGAPRRIAHVNRRGMLITICNFEQSCTKNRNKKHFSWTAPETPTSGPAGRERPQAAPAGPPAPRPAQKPKTQTQLCNSPLW